MFFSDQITYYVVPYGLYGGGEIYIENHIKQGTFKNIHLLFFYNNPLKQHLTGISPCTEFKTLALIEQFLISIKARCVAFHNSFQVYCMLQRVRKAIGANIIEVVHSNLKWEDSMHCADRADVGMTIAVSDAVAREMSLKKFKVIPPIIDRSRFNVPRRLSKKITVGTVARFAPYKNLTRIVDIAKCTNEDFQFIIIGGDGGTMNQVQQRIVAEGLMEKIIIKPFTSTIEQEYAGFDVFLLTSFEEGRPLVIEEAVAAGLPVVTSVSGGIPEQMAGRDGHLYSLDDADDDIARHLMAWGRQNREKKLHNPINGDRDFINRLAACPDDAPGPHLYLRPGHRLPALDNYAPLVSFYVPTYNCGKFLPQAIASALAQTYPNVEVCICDDGSTDNTLEILTAEYGQNDRVRWIAQENKGVGAASAKAVSLCRGDLLGQLDADDWLEPTAVAEAVQLFQKHPAIGLVYAGHREVDEDGRELKTFIPDQFDRNRMLLGMLVGHFKIFKREIYDLTSGFINSTAQDYDISMKISEYTQCFRYSGVLYNYRKHDNSLTALDINAQTEDATSVIDRALRRQGLPYKVLPSFPGSFMRQLFFDRSAFNSLTISVVIVNHDRSSRLVDVLQSLCHQTHRPVEMIVVDVGCVLSREGHAAVEEIASKPDIPPCRIVSCANVQEAGAVVSKVIQAAAGDYIAFQDPQYISVPDRLRYQLMTLTCIHKLCLFSGTSAPLPQGAVVRRKPLTVESRFDGNAIIGGSLMISRRVATIFRGDNLINDILNRFGDKSVIVINKTLMCPV